jgi:hypothetical protein
MARQLATSISSRFWLSAQLLRGLVVSLSAAHFSAAMPSRKRKLSATAPSASSNATGARSEASSADRGKEPERKMWKRGRTDKLWQAMLGSQGQQRWKSIQDIQSFYKERITCLGMWPAFKVGMAGWEDKPVRLGTGFDGAGLAGKVFPAVVGSAGPE